MDEIVVTGIGIISACGVGRESFWKSCLSGKTGIAPIQSFDTSAYSSHLGAEIRDFNPKDFMPPLKYRRMSRVSRLAVAASIEALKDAAFSISSQAASSMGVVIGTGYGSTAQTDEFFVGMLKEGHDWANQRFYSYPSMLKRFWPIRRCHQVFLPANWGMRRAWNLLAKPTL